MACQRVHRASCSIPLKWEPLTSGIGMIYNNRGDWPNLEPNVAIQPYIAVFLHTLESYVLRITSMARASD